jgi:hypothetical protein
MRSSQRRKEADRERKAVVKLERVLQACGTACLPGIGKRKPHGRTLSKLHASQDMPWKIKAGLRRFVYVDFRANGRRLGSWQTGFVPSNANYK